MRESIDTIYSLSSMQQLIYEGMKAGYCTNTIQHQIRIKGSLPDDDLLRSSYSLLVKRHDALRTVVAIPEGSETLKNLVMKERYANMSILDLRLELPSVREQELHDILASDNDCDVSEGCFISLSYIKMSDMESVFIWRAQRLAADIQSLDILHNDLMEVYSKLESGGAFEELYPTPTSYRDYVDWHEKQDMGKGYAYWDKLLANYAGLEQSDAKIYNIQAITHQLDADLLDSLGSFSMEYGIDSDVILETAFSLQLMRNADVRDIVYSKAIPGRHAPVHGIGQMVGPLACCIPVRISITDRITVLELMFAMQKQALDSLYFSYMAGDMGFGYGCSVCEGEDAENLMKSASQLLYDMLGEPTKKVIIMIDSAYFSRKNNSLSQINSFN